LAKQDSNKPKFTNYAEAKENFDKLHSSTRGSYKTAIYDMVDALKAEEKTHEEARKILQRDLKGAVDRRYIDRLCEERYMTAEEIKARTAKLTAQEQQQEAQRKERIMVSADGSTSVIYEDEDDSNSGNTSFSSSGTNISELDPVAQREALKSSSSLISKGVKKGSSDIPRLSKDKALKDDSELNSLEDDPTEEVTLQLSGNRIEINDPEHLDKISNMISTGKSIIILVDSNLGVQEVMAGPPSH
jgi:hypothetical protein